jgi:hypothetical protein
MYMELNYFHFLNLLICKLYNTTQEFYTKGS